MASAIEFSVDPIVDARPGINSMQLYRHFRQSYGDATWAAPPDVWSEVDPACLTRKILSLAGCLWTHGRQRDTGSVTTFSGFSPSVIHPLAKFRVICEDPIVVAARMVYRLVYFLGSLFKGRLGT